MTTQTYSKIHMSWLKPHLFYFTQIYLDYFVFVRRSSICLGNFCAVQHISVLLYSVVVLFVQDRTVCTAALYKVPLVQSQKKIFFEGRKELPSLS